jgi:Rrf2 family protein
VRMRLSMKTEYGVRAVVELAANAGRGALQSGEIARRQSIPGPFLDQVLMTLRRAGFVHSTRGPHGGHVLARRPEEIRLDELIACLEGDGVKSRQQDASASGDSQVLAQVTEKAERAARDVFASHTLADCLRLRRTEPRVFHGIFHAVPIKPRGA